MKRLTKTYIQHSKCPKCGSDAITEWCPPGISTKCTKCDYGIATTLFHPIDSDETEYCVFLESKQDATKPNLSILSRLTGYNFIKCKEILINGGILKSGFARDVNELIDILLLANLKFAVKPEWKYFSDPLDSDKNWTRNFNEKIKLKFWFEWDCESPFWPLNDRAYEMGIPVLMEDLPLSKKLIEDISQLCKLHDSALDWDNPENGIIWNKEQIADFNKKAKAIFKLAVKELGEDFEVEYSADETI